MVKEEVEKEFFAGDFQSILPPNEGEPNAEFDEEFLDVIEQPQFEIAFTGVGVHGEEIKNVWILKCLMCEIGLRRR